MSAVLFRALSALIVVFALTGPVWAAPLDLNTATVEELDAQLEGIGPTKAQAIVAYRETNGPFSSVEQLLEVDGIGPSTLERIRSQLTVGEG